MRSTAGDRIVLRFMRRAIMGVAFAGVAASAFAGATEKAASVVKSASGVATKTEGAVKRGLGAAGSGVERGAKAAGNAVTGVAKKAGVPGAGASSPKPPQSAP
jgi:hypothetical protein